MAGPPPAADNTVMLIVGVFAALVIGLVGYFVMSQTNTTAEYAALFARNASSQRPHSLEFRLYLARRLGQAPHSWTHTRP